MIQRKILERKYVNEEIQLRYHVISDENVCLFNVTEYGNLRNTSIQLKSIKHDNKERAYKYIEKKIQQPVFYIGFWKIDNKYKKSTRTISHKKVKKYNMSQKRHHQHSS